MDRKELLKEIEVARKDGLEELDLFCRGIDTLPSEIGQLTSLKRLNLGRNRLKTLPAEIGQLTHLQDLYILQNSLAHIPPEIGQLTSLKTLDLSHNRLETIPPEIGQLTHLQELYIWQNSLAHIPPEIGQLTSLKTLDLSHNRLETLPAEIGQLTSLKTLDLSHNRLETLPAEIGQLTNLQELDLRSNRLMSPPGEIGQLTSLKRLCLGTMRVYRWHISRKLEEHKVDQERGVAVDVTITPARDAFTSVFTELRVETARDLPPDDIMWWHTEEDFRLEGTTTEAALREALTERNLLPERFTPELEDRERRIAEDMVFLQLVEDEGVYEYEMLWERLSAERGWPDVTELVKVEGARWLDYTLPSRRMAKELYAKVLSKIEETEEEADASQY